jgi:hypothetical protein
MGVGNGKIYIDKFFDDANQALPNGFGWGLIGLGQINACIGLPTSQACIQDCTPLGWWVLKVGWCLKTDLWVDLEHTPWLPWVLKISLLWGSPQFLVFCSKPGSPIKYFCDWQCWQFGTGQLRVISWTGGEDKPIEFGLLNLFAWGPTHG